MDAEGKNDMPIQHAIELIRSYKEARGGLFVSVFLVGWLMGLLGVYSIFVTD